MKVVEDQRGRLRFVGRPDWLRIGVGLMFLLLPLFPVFLASVDGRPEPPAHRTVQGTRNGATAVIVLTEQRAAQAPETWRTDAAAVEQVRITTEDRRTSRGATWRLYSLGLHMKAGEPWMLFSSYEEAPLRERQRALEAFLADPTRTSVTVEQPAAPEPVSHLAMMLAVGVPCGLSALWLLHSGLAARHQGVVIDRLRQTVTVSGRPGGDLVLPVADIVGIVPFDPRDRLSTDSFAMVLDTKSHGRVRLGELPNPKARALDGLGRGKGPNKAEIASAQAAHAELAGRIAALVGLRDPGRDS